MPAPAPQHKIAQDRNKLDGGQPDATCVAVRRRTDKRFAQGNPVDDHIQEAAQGRAEEERHKEENEVHCFINQPK